MSARHSTRGGRFRLATNDNETIVVARRGKGRFRLATNDNETIVVARAAR